MGVIRPKDRRLRQEIPTHPTYPPLWDRHMRDFWLSLCTVSSFFFNPMTANLCVISCIFPSNTLLRQLQKQPNTQIKPRGKKD